MKIIRPNLDIIKSGSILAQVTNICISLIKVGATPVEIDRIIDKEIIYRDAQPSFKGYHGYQAASCISVNNTLVHGVPTNVPFKHGDVISVDLGVKFRDWHTDAAFTIALEPVDYHIKNALANTRKALYAGIAAAKPGKHIGDISSAIESVANSNNLGIIKELSGHGIGNQLHLSPSIPNYGASNTGKKIIPGMMLAIEPMFSVNKNPSNKIYPLTNIITSQDNWSIELPPSQIGIHFEHSIYVTEDEPIILTRYVDTDKTLW